MNEHKLQSDSDGFLIGRPLNPSKNEHAMLARLIDDVRAMRLMMEARKGKAGSDKRAANDADKPEENEGKNPGVRSVASANAQTIATPKLTLKINQSLLARDIASGMVIATPRIDNPERTKQDERFRDAMGRFMSDVKPAKPVLAVDPKAPILSPKAMERLIGFSGTPAKPVAPGSMVKPGSVTGAGSTAAGGRDEKGRFTKDGDSDESGSKMRKLLGDIRDRIAGPDLSGAEEVDPNIKAAQEIAGLAGGAIQGVKSLTGFMGAVASPVFNGVMGMGKAKPGDAPTPWFRRFFGELRSLRREESVFNRAQLRVLKEIEAKPGEGKDGGFWGMLMMFAGPLIAAIGAAVMAGFGLLMKLPGVGLLAKLATGLMPAALLPKRAITQPTMGAGAPTQASGKAVTGTKLNLPGALPGLDAAGKTMGEAKPAGLLARAGSGVGSVLKRVPLLGSLLAAVGAGAGVLASETDDTTTRAEKDKSTGKAIGGGAGSIAGMMAGGAAGAAIGAWAGPVGLAIGGVVGAVAGGFFGEKGGDIVGATVGGWVTEIRAADIPGMISRVWGKTTDTMVTAWAGTTKWFEDKWGSALTVFGGVLDKARGVFDDLSIGVTVLLGKVGIDLPALKQKAASLAEAAAGKVMAAKDAVMTNAVAAKDKTVQGVGAVVDAGKEKAGQVGDALKNTVMARGAGLVGGKLADGWKSAKDYLVGASTKAGVDPGIVAKIAAYESKFDSTAAPKRKDGSLISSAHGFGQFIDSTWTEMLNKHGAKYGVEGAGKLTKTDADKLRGDKGLQASMLAELTKENIERGRANGGKDDDANVYANHNLGASDATKLIKGMEAGLNVREALSQGGVKTDKERARIEAVINGNKSLYGDGTVKASEAYNRMGEVMRRGEVFAQDARATATANATTNATFTPPAIPTPRAVVTAGAIAIPSIPTVAAVMPRIPEMSPAIYSVPTETMTNQKPVTVVVSGGKELVGRDLRSRPLAHIVTGGLSGGGGG
jgi:hypothetical protein